MRRQLWFVYRRLRSTRGTGRDGNFRVACVQDGIFFLDIGPGPSPVSCGFGLYMGGVRVLVLVLGYLDSGTSGLDSIGMVRN